MPGGRGGGGGGNDIAPYVGIAVAAAAPNGIGGGAGIPPPLWLGADPKPRREAAADPGGKGGGLSLACGTTVPGGRGGGGGMPAMVAVYRKCGWVVLVPKAVVDFSCSVEFRPLSAFKTFQLVFLSQYLCCFS